MFDHTSGVVDPACRGMDYGVFRVFVVVRGHPVYIPGFPIWIWIVRRVKMSWLLPAVEHRAQQPLFNAATILINEGVSLKCVTRVIISACVHPPRSYASLVVAPISETMCLTLSHSTRSTAAVWMTLTLRVSSRPVLQQLSASVQHIWRTCFLARHRPQYPQAKERVRVSNFAAPTNQ